MTMTKRWTLLGGLGAIVVVALACGDDGKSSSAPTTTASTVGKACVTSNDCGMGATCNTQQTFGMLGDLLTALGGSNLPAPGGYCTTSCSSDTDCGSNAVCLGAALGIFKGECRHSCTSNADCRDGYECAMQAEIPADAGLPPALTTLRLPSQCQAKPAANVLTGQAGTPCTNRNDGGVATECGAGFCAGNACTGVCTEDSTCGAGAVCVQNGFYGSAGTCTQSCGSDTDCKTYKANGNVGCIAAGSRMVCGPKVYAIAPNMVGKACAADADCGTTGQCLTAIGLAQTPTPGGYCSVIGCQDDSVCGGGSCIAATATCAAPCTSDASCRPGYSCQSLNSTARTRVDVCAPSGDGTKPTDAGTRPTDAGTKPTDAGVSALPDAG
ncbi:MAG: Multiple EGF-like-domain protein 3 precursor [Myxococcaceae bacterium]|nr:Multiple EGF-like-domain protein 3 precursor [Myxococcaceae bacterium]